MPLNPAYITSVDINPYLADKTSGAPLAGGYISFYEDDSRTTPKAVYELTGSPPNYAYTALPNPIQLSATGTIADASGNNCALYYYPYAADGVTLQLYYIEVTDYLGNPQFTREGWPNVTPETDPNVAASNTLVNLLSNPQFAQVLFNPTLGLTIPYSGAGTLTVPIAPDWNLVIVYTGAGSVIVNRASLTGTAEYPTNPPYTLSITPGANIASSGLYLSQRLYHNPGLWCPQPGSTLGWVVTNALIGPGVADVANNLTIQYVPSNNALQAQTLFDMTNTSGTYAELSQCVELEPSTNTDTADVGYTDIRVYITIGTTVPTILSSLQICWLESEVSDNSVKFQQIPVNRQNDELFHYYNPQLQYKPTNSYLIGWDFPYNPAQLNTSTVPAVNTGSNGSYYAWDQTIVFQSVTSSVNIARGTNGDNSFQMTCVSAGQVALIQYLDATTARDLLNGRLSVNLLGYSSVALSGKVTLWYTTNASLPVITADNASGPYASAVTSLDSSGFPTLVGGWTQVARSNLGDAVWTVGTTQTNQGFNGWQDVGSGATTATFFAIVVGTQVLSRLSGGQIVNFNSISLVPGDIPTIPAPKPITEVLRDCQRFYEKSYSTQTAVGTITNNNMCIAQQNFNQYVNNGGTALMDGGIGAFQLTYEQAKRVANPTITFYSTASGASGNVYYQFIYPGMSGGNPYTQDAAITLWTTISVNWDRATYLPSVTANSALKQFLDFTGNYMPVSYIQYHVTIDARLGVV